MNVLEKIVLDKRAEVEQRKVNFPLYAFESSLVQSNRSMAKAIKTDKKNHGAGYILEVKQASPSKGLIRENFDLEEICGAYKDYASVVSVLTDEKYFSGDFERITRVREILSQPVLCKDFFIDTYQVKLARFYGADAILLMLSVLDDEQYSLLAKTAEQYGLDILTEVSNLEEMKRAVGLNAQIIGINNRNLRDLSTDLKQTIRLTDELKSLVSAKELEELTLISESGIHLHQQTKALANCVDGFLVGSSLMAENDINKACRDLIVGQHKVCGLTHIEDIAAAYNAGANYHGAILVEASKRNLSLNDFQTIADNDSYPSHPNLVVVVKDKTCDELLTVVDQFKPTALQLHGSETPEFVSIIKNLIGQHSFSTQIWKVIHCSESSLSANLIQDCQRYIGLVDGLLLDTALPSGGSGGTGLPFNWGALDTAEFRGFILDPSTPPILLAGGLGPDNLNEAMMLPVNGFDFNSKLETEPGKKSEQLINIVFSKLNSRIFQKDNHEQS